MEIQYDLGSDIVMIFDECTPYLLTGIMQNAPWRCCTLGEAAKRERFDSLPKQNALFGIIQGTFTKIYVIFLLKVW